MSGKDVNPFADPAEINPFASPSAKNKEDDFSNDFNPFAVQQSTPAAVNTTQSPVSPKSPTPKSPPQKSPPPPPPVFSQSSSPATIETVSTKTQTPAFKSYGSTSDAALKERIEELEKKGADLERVEAELNRKKLIFSKQNNFPPLPKCCCVGPCFFHDINIEIPLEHQRTCRMVFYTWELYVLTIFFNLVSALAGLCVGATDGAILFGISILYFVLFPILSFVCWYRPLYKALKSGSSFNYFMFFFVFGCQTIMTFIYALGINSVGTCGWINGAQLAGDLSHAVSVMYFVSAALFTTLLIFEIYLIRRVHRTFRTSGASLQKAQQEFAKDVVSNKTVQQAATDAVIAGSK